MFRTSIMSMLLAPAPLAHRARSACATSGMENASSVATRRMSLLRGWIEREVVAEPGGDVEDLRPAQVVPHGVRAPFHRQPCGEQRIARHLAEGRQHHNILPPMAH